MTDNDLLDVMAEDDARKAGKALAVKLVLMAGATTAVLVAANVVIKAIEKKS